MDITVISSVLFGPFSLSHYKTTVKGQISFFERREVGKGGLLGNFQKKKILYSKNCQLLLKQNACKNRASFFTLQVRNLRQKKTLIHNLKVPKKN